MRNPSTRIGAVRASPGRACARASPRSRRRARPLSRMPKLPRKFHRAQPQPASFQAARQSRIQGRTTACGVRLWAPNSPTITPTPFACSAFQGATWSFCSVDRVPDLAPLAERVGRLRPAVGAVDPRRLVVRQVERRRSRASPPRRPGRPARSAGCCPSRGRRRRSAGRWSSLRIASTIRSTTARCASGPTWLGSLNRLKLSSRVRDALVPAGEVRPVPGADVLRLGGRSRGPSARAGWRPCSRGPGGS